MAVGSTPPQRAATQRAPAGQTAVGVRGKLHSHWVAMAQRERDLGAIATDRRSHACARSRGAVGTDDYSNPVGALGRD